MDAELTKLIFYRLQQCFTPVPGKKFYGRVLRYSSIFGAVFSLHCCGKLLHVIAGIPVYRKFRWHPQQLLISGVQRSPQILHLFARVIDVVFALDIETDGLCKRANTSPMTATTPVDRHEGDRSD